LNINIKNNLFGKYKLFMLFVFNNWLLPVRQFPFILNNNLFQQLTEDFGNQSKINALDY